MTSSSVDGSAGWHRPCLDCHGLGERWAEVGRLVLDAAPRLSASKNGDGQRMRTPGDPVARDVLDVQATRWQDAGDPLGERLALWLSGRDEWTNDVEITNARSC